MAELIDLPELVEWHHPQGVIMGVHSHWSQFVCATSPVSTVQCRHRLDT